MDTSQAYLRTNGRMPAVLAEQRSPAACGGGVLDQHCQPQQPTEPLQCGCCG